MGQLHSTNTLYNCYNVGLASFWGRAWTIWYVIRTWYLLSCYVYLQTLYHLHKFRSQNANNNQQDDTGSIDGDQDEASGSTLMFEEFLMFRAFRTDLEDEEPESFLLDTGLISTWCWDLVNRIFFRGEPDPRTYENAPLPGPCGWYEERVPFRQLFNLCKAVHYECHYGVPPPNFCGDVPDQELGLFRLLHTQIHDIHPNNTQYLSNFVSTVITYSHDAVSIAPLPRVGSRYISHRKPFSIDTKYKFTACVDGYMYLPFHRTRAGALDTTNIVFIVEAKRRSTMSSDQLFCQITSELETLIYSQRDAIILAFKKEKQERQHRLLVQFGGDEAYFYVASFGRQHVDFLASVRQGRKGMRVYDESSKDWLGGGFVQIARCGPLNIKGDPRDMTRFAKACVGLYLTACEKSGDKCVVDLYQLVQCHGEVESFMAMLPYPWPRSAPRRRAYTV
ncbi:hypothetical protein F4860DRAFT_492776 [Xylaria cubensis]|nr:hypothetical protein F4860DRAFT_492776 [Xylaria cubensis]